MSQTDNMRDGGRDALAADAVVRGYADYADAQPEESGFSADDAFGLLHLDDAPKQDLSVCAEERLHASGSGYERDLGGCWRDGEGYAWDDD